MITIAVMNPNRFEQPIRKYFGNQIKARLKISDSNCWSRRRVLESPEASLSFDPKFFRLREEIRAHCQFSQHKLI